MKKALANTRVSVKLRKSEYREEWYLYVEAYPVFQADKSTPQRVREYLNRTITTPIWDKSRNARTDKDGKTTYYGKAKQICPLWPKRIAPFGHNMIDPSGPNNIDHLARILPEIFLCRFKPPSPGVTGY